MGKKMEGMSGNEADDLDKVKERKKTKEEGGGAEQVKDEGIFKREKTKNG